MTRVWKGFFAAIGDTDLRDQNLRQTVMLKRANKATAHDISTVVEHWKLVLEEAAVKISQGCACWEGLEGGQVSLPHTGCG